MGGGPPGFPQGFSCLVVLWILLANFRFRLLDFHRLWLAFPKPFDYPLLMLNAVRNPEEPGPSVWPLSRSLAATKEIEFSFSSYCYLDVSVHSVPFHTLWIHVWMYKVCLYRFPHSDICGSIGYLLLTAAFRSLSRLSSALSAKASTLRSFLLDLNLISIALEMIGFAILDCLVCLQTFVYKTILVCYFSDVLIKIFIFLNLSLSV